jgi:hypothetical protein
MALPKADNSGNTLVNFTSQGQLYLIKDGKRVDPAYANIPLFQVTDKGGCISARAEFRDSHFVVALEFQRFESSELYWVFYVLKKDGSLETDEKYWNDFKSPYRVLDAINKAGVAYESSTEWSGYTWKSTELQGRFDWLFNPKNSLISIHQTNLGPDTLTGIAKKKDFFDFQSKPEYGSNTDKITNFSTKDKDQLRFSKSAFGVGTGKFAIAKDTKSLNKLLASDANFVYNQPKGELTFNANGIQSGFGENGGVFAVLVGKPSLVGSSVSFI